MSKHSKKSKIYISVVLAFLLSVFLTMISYLFGVYFGLLNKTLIVDTMNKTSYYTEIIDYTQTQANDLAIPMGLDQSVYDGVFILEESYREGKAILLASLNKTDYTPDTADIRQRLVDNVKDYIASLNITLTAEQEVNLSEFADTIISMYVKNLSVPYIDYFENIRSTISQAIYIGLPILFVLSAGAILLLTKLHKWLHRALRYIAYSTLATALMTTIFPLYLLLDGTYKRINLAPEYFYKLITSYITQSLIIFFYVASIFLIISILLIIFINYRRNALKKKEHFS